MHIASPLSEHIPAFCLACLGTNDKYSLVVQRWNSILSECAKRNITVVSFAADGDSRALKAMLLSSHIFYNTSLPDSANFNKVALPTDWSPWFTIKTTNGIAYVQDVVHLAVKMKARLLRSSIVLPLDPFLAGVHHLHLIQASYGKDTRDMRENNIDHKDRQNYDAVLHITSGSVLGLVLEMQEALGTYTYQKVMRSIIDIYLDKNLDAKTRIEKVWYGVHLMRYWQEWILLNPKYSLGSLQMH